MSDEIGEQKNDEPLGSKAERVRGREPISIGRPAGVKSHTTGAAEGVWSGVFTCVNRFAENARRVANPPKKSYKPS